MKVNINELRLDFVKIQTHPEKYDLVVIGVTKRCSKCNDVKLLSEFNKNKNIKDNHRYECRICQSKHYENNKEEIKEQKKEYYKNNREEIIEHQKEYYENNKEQRKKYLENNKEQISEYYKEYNKNNKEQIREKQKEYKKNRIKTDPLFKLTKNIGKSTAKAFKNSGFTKQSKTAEILGCSFEEFQEHIGKQMSRWMNWDNQGKYKKDVFNYGWDIDHIIPLSSAKTEEELLKLCHYTNLQPLCSKVNRDIKKDKIDFYDNQN